MGIARICAAPVGIADDLIDDLIVVPARCEATSCEMGDSPEQFLYLPGVK